MRVTSALGVLLYCSLSVYPGQVADGVAGTVIEGTTQPTTGSPVELTDANYTLCTFKAEENKFQLVAEGVKIRNVSGRAIRRVTVRFVHNHLGYSGDVCRGNQGFIAVDDLAVGETRHFNNDRITITWCAQENDMALTVIATGAEFKDGSHWAALRSESCPLSADCLFHPAPLRWRESKLTDDRYNVALEISDPQIVAYRLGIVRDTAESFEVRVGDEIELTDDQRVRGARIVDAGKSLSSNLIFPRQPYSSTARGKRITTFVGAAIFVAELRFADGRIWQQDQSREGLFWNN